MEEIAIEKLEKDQTGKRNQQFKPPLPIFNTHQSKPRSGNQCVYCEDDNHRAINCTKVTSVYERQKIISEKKLCFNCTSTRHHADECKSKLRCQICDRKHHTSICHKQENQANPLLVATGIPTGNVTYPVVVVEVEGIKCHLDVLGLSDTLPNDQSSVYAEFKEQLVRHEEGWYKTGLPWRGNHPVLPNNKDGSLRRLASLNKKLENSTYHTNLS